MVPVWRRAATSIADQRRHCRADFSGIVPSIVVQRQTGAQGVRAQPGSGVNALPFEWPGTIVAYTSDLGVASRSDDLELSLLSRGEPDKINWEQKVPRSHGLRISVVLVYALGLALLGSMVMGFADFQRLRGGREPLFSTVNATYRDGGSRDYLGFGYSLHLRIRFGPPVQPDIGPPSLRGHGSRRTELQFWFVPYRFHTVRID